MTTILLQPLVPHIVIHIVIEIRPINFWGLRINVGDFAHAHTLLNGLENIGSIGEGKKIFKVID